MLLLRILNMLGLYLFIGLLHGITASDGNETVGVISSSIGLLIVNCSDVSIVSRCSNMQVVPYAFAGLDTLANISSPYSIQNMLFENDDNLTKLLCNYKENADGDFCSHSKVENCTSRFPFFLKNIFPTEERIRQMQKLICGNRQKYDGKCVSSKMDEMLKCVNVSDVLNKVVNNTSIDKYTELLENVTCRHYALGRVCARRLLQPCGQTTMQMYIHSIPDFSECKGRSEIQVPDIDCSSSIDTMFSYLDCLHKTDLFLKLPQLTSSDAISEYILRTMSLDLNKEVCSNLQTYTEAVNCTLHVQRECSEDIMKPTVPDTATVINGFIQLCQKIQDFNTTCMIAKTMNVCTRRRRQTIAEQIILKHMCEDVALRNRCLYSTTRSCGVDTAAMYRDLLTSQRPQMCLKPGNGHPGLIG